MQSTRMMGCFAKQLADEKNFTTEQLAENINCTTQQLEAFFTGRFLFPFSKVKTLSDILGVSVSKLIDGDGQMYNSYVVHCMGEFDDPEEREFILDLIDDYLDIKEAAD